MGVQAKDRLLASAIKLGQRDGWARLTVSDVLADSGAARRSFYTHFPGGAKELTLSAVGLAADWITSVVRESCLLESPQALDAFVCHWKVMLETSDFSLGCPIAAAAASRLHHPEAADLAVRAFEEWEALIAAALVRDGASKREARRLGVLAVASVEGAVIRSIAARSCEPMDLVHAGLRPDLQAAMRATQP